MRTTIGEVLKLFGLWIRSLDTCKIQDAACGQSNIMICLKLVKTSMEDAANSICKDHKEMLQGTKVLLNLVEPWANTNTIVCADSYFASVGAALALKSIGLRFIGVVKTATTTEAK